MKGKSVLVVTTQQQANNEHRRTSSLIIRKKAIHEKYETPEKRRKKTSFTREVTTAKSSNAEARLMSQSKGDLGCFLEKFGTTNLRGGEGSRKLRAVNKRVDRM